MYYLSANVKNDGLFLQDFQNEDINTFGCINLHESDVITDVIHNYSNDENFANIQNNQFNLVDSHESVLIADVNHKKSDFQEFPSE
jgi:hypothetical protein